MLHRHIPAQEREAFYIPHLGVFYLLFTILFVCIVLLAGNGCQNQLRNAEKTLTLESLVPARKAKTWAVTGLLPDSSGCWLAIPPNLKKAPGTWLVDLHSNTLEFVPWIRFSGWTDKPGEMIGYGIRANGWVDAKKRYDLKRHKATQLPGLDDALSVISNVNWPGMLLVCGIKHERSGHLGYSITMFDEAKGKSTVLAEFANRIDYSSVLWPGAGDKVYWQIYRGSPRKCVILAKEIKGNGDARVIASDTFHGMAASRDGHYLFYVSKNPLCIHMLDTTNASDTILPVPCGLTRPYTLTCSSTGDKVAVADIQGGLWLVDIKTKTTKLLESKGFAPVWLHGEHSGLFYIRDVSDNKPYEHQILWSDIQGGQTFILAGF